jgi:hypothetical protein
MSTMRAKLVCAAVAAALCAAGLVGAVLSGQRTPVHAARLPGKWRPAPVRGTPDAPVEEVSGPALAPAGGAVDEQGIPLNVASLMQQRQDRNQADLADAYERFEQGEKDVEITRKLSGMLSERLDKIGVDRSALQEAECRGNLCRVQVVFEEGEITKAAGLADARSLRVHAVDVQHAGDGHVRIIAFVEPKPKA